MGCVCRFVCYIEEEVINLSKDRKVRHTLKGNAEEELRRVFQEQGLKIEALFCISFPFSTGI